MLRVNGKFNISGEVACGDKSISHRALILASIAEGNSVIRNLSVCQDVLSTAKCLRALGAEINIENGVAYVTPIKKANNGVTLDCGNSGTTARLLAGLVAGLGVRAKFTGDETLVKRPMERVLKPLEKMGAKFKRYKNGLFESCGGSLLGSEIVAEVNSAQVKSAVLIAGLFAAGVTVYCEKLPTRNHTELMLYGCGADIKSDGLNISVSRSTLKSLNLTVPNDPSSVAYLIALSLLAGKNTSFDNVLLNERRLGFFNVLKRCGANLLIHNNRVEHGENVGSVSVFKSELKPLYASIQDVCDAIDELPVLSAIALAIRGEHRFCNVSELRYKESDRINAIVRTAEKCGQTARMEGEDLIIISNGNLCDNPLFKSFGDHRMAMSQIVLALYCGGGSVDSAPFNVSFPNFLMCLGVAPLRLGVVGENVNSSKSPLLMNYLSSKVNVCCSYEPVNLSCETSDEKLLAVIKSFDGLNVTMPFKVRVAKLLRAEIGFVNTIGKNIIPQSTDGYGIVKALRAHGIEFKDKKLWIVGAGGAAETCVDELLKYGCEMEIFNRTQSGADALPKKYGLKNKITAPYGVLSFVPDCEFERKLVLPDSVEFVFSADYKSDGGLKKQAMNRGIDFIDGLEMLFYQGAKSFSVWTGTPVQDDFNGFLNFANGFV